MGVGTWPLPSLVRPEFPYRLQVEVRQDRGLSGLTETIPRTRDPESLFAMLLELCLGSDCSPTWEDIRSCPSILVSLPQWDLCSGCHRA